MQSAADANDATVAEVEMREVRRLTKVHGLKNKSTNAKRDGSQSESERVKVCLCNTYNIHISIMYMLRIYA